MPRTPQSHRLKQDNAEKTQNPAVLFDLDGTLIDSNYQHVNAWAKALAETGVVIPLWKIHRRVGMSGKSFLKELLRELGRVPNNGQLQRLEEKHDKHFRRAIPKLQPLPGADKLLSHVARSKVRIAIATSGGRKQTSLMLRHLKIPASIPVVTGDDVEKAKPAPDIFMAAAAQLQMPIDNCIVVGDSVWDVRGGPKGRPCCRPNVRRLCPGRTGARRCFPRVFRYRRHAHAPRTTGPSGILGSGDEVFPPSTREGDPISASLVST